MFLGISLVALGGWILVNVMFVFGLILILVGLTVSSLGIIPAKTAEDESGVVQKRTSRRSSSIRLFWVLFAAMVFWSLFIGFNLLLVAVASVPLAIWILAETRRIKSVNFQKDRDPQSKPTSA